MSRTVDVSRNEIFYQILKFKKKTSNICNHVVKSSFDDDFDFDFDICLFCSSFFVENDDKNEFRLTFVID